MRLRDLSAALCHLFPLMLVVALATPAMAQFREVPSGPSAPTATDGVLVPTRQPFVTPRGVAAPVPGASSAEVSGAEVAPTEAVPEPTPALQEADEPVGDDGRQTEPLEVRPLQTWAAFQAPNRRDRDEAVAAPSPESTPAVVSFNQIEPGVTTLPQLKQHWGEPSNTRAEGQVQVLSYAVPGFRQVDVRADETDQIVQSVLVHLSTRVSLEELEPYLGLKGIDPVEVPDEEGTVLGQGYPERGVLLTCFDGEGTNQVTHVSLETIRGELYRMRAKHDSKNRFTRSLADLDEAIRLDPQDAHACWLRAELQSIAGHSDAARESVEQAVKIDSSNPLHRLSKARLDAEHGQVESALKETQSVADTRTTPEIVRARAEYQWGNLLAMGLEPDFQQALAHHMKAIDQAARHLGDCRVAVRRMAKDILVDAHLAVAQDIALGDFQRQQEVVPKWLIKATELAEDFIANDEGDETLRMEVYRTTLAVYSVLEGSFDTSVATEEAIEEGRRLIAQSDDVLYQHRVERELSESLFYAARVEHRRGELGQALVHANNAVALLDGQSAERQPSLFDQVMAGQLYFLVGSLYAIDQEDHEEAVRWFDKAQPLFDRDGLANLVDNDSFGDLFVSMGVSYWETGAKDVALQLTQVGAELMQNAVQTGSLDLAALSIPYGNLTAMYTELGDQQQAKHYAAMLAKVENGQIR